PDGLRRPAEAPAATYPKGDGRPAAQSDGDRLPGAHREHSGYLHGAARRPRCGVSRAGAVPGWANRQEGPATLRHPAQYVRGQLAASRSWHRADPVVVSMCRTLITE